MQDNSFFSGSLNHWIEFNLRFNSAIKDNGDWTAEWAIACHKLWFWRNKEQHEVAFVRPSRPRQVIKSLAKDYKGSEQIATYCDWS
jgi:hypothetical protein